MAKDATQTNAGTGGVSVFASTAIDAPAETLWHNEEKDDNTNKVVETVSKNQTNIDQISARLDAAAAKQLAQKDEDQAAATREVE